MKWNLLANAQVLAVAMLANQIAAHAQNFPSKPIRVVAAEAGGGGDFGARMVALGLTAGLGQQVIVDNRGIAAIDIVAKAPADGYTLLIYGQALWIGPLLRPMTYSALNDFAPISLLTSAPDVLVVHPSLPVKSVKDLIALAKRRSGELNYASGSTGAAPHLEAEMFKVMAGINIVHVAFKGNAAAFNSLLGGEVQIMFANFAQVTAYVRSNKLRALAVTSAKPSALAPELPTMAGAGVPGYESLFILGMLAPARTPAAIVDKLNHEVELVLQRSDIKEKFLNSGVEVSGGSPGDFSMKMASDIARWGKLIKEAGIRQD